MSMPDSAAAAAALADATSARRGMVSSVVYPASYLPLVAFSGAGIMLLAAVGSGKTPAVISVVFNVIGLCSVAAAGVAIAQFQARNGVRISGLRGPAVGLGVAFVISLAALAIAVAGIASLTGAWWLGLIAAPVGAAIQVAYAMRWLSLFQGQA